MAAAHDVDTGRGPKLAKVPGNYRTGYERSAVDRKNSSGQAHLETCDGRGYGAGSVGLDRNVKTGQLVATQGS